MSELAIADTKPIEMSKMIESKSVFGFWMYLMTDCVVFACLFATYAVLHQNTNGGPSGSELFSLPYILVETLLLLTSSFSCGLAILAAYRRNKNLVITFFIITFILGLAFLTMELVEFRHLVIEGNSWRRSGFLSSYFTLVGTHGLHITIGLIWMATMMVQVYRRGLANATIRRLTMLSLFWHFLDIIWIFIFTVVYLFGAIQP
jgi:cytochrome o ubiquinol oxidase subunit III